MCIDSRVVCGRLYLSCLLALTIVFPVCAIPFTSATCNNPVVLGDSNIIHEDHHVARNPGHHVTGNSYTDDTLQGSLILYNGSIYTMDKDSRVVSVLGIRDGWIVYAGNDLTKAESKTAWELGLTRRINLRRRVAIPGLIDCHNHIVLLGNRPGHHTPLEQAFTLAEVLDTYRRRASEVPRGDFITTIGGFAPLQFQENRLPTLAELDTAVPNHPVFISTGFTGPAVTNSLGKAFFERLPGNTSVSVAVNGSIANGIENGKALLSLRQRLTFADRVRSTRDAMAYAASLGVTTLLDQGGFPATNTPTDGAGNEDLLSMHLPFLSLYNSLSQHPQNDDSLPPPPLIRLRINYLQADADASLPTLTNRLQYAYPFFGNAMVRTGGIGEFAVSFEDYAGGELFEAAAAKIARAGWRLEVHSLTDTDFRSQIEGFEAVHAALPLPGIRPLRWVVAHVPRITLPYLQRLKALGGGVNVSGYMYLAGAGAGNASTPAGPPFKSIVGSGIPAGFGVDGANIAPLSPWPHAYYATTGRNARGEIVNAGETIDRPKVLDMFTRDNTWFLGGPDEKLLGTLEVGRLGDVAVLSHDYFSVSDDELKRIRSVMTVVGGVVIHNSGELEK